jgi:hypothetical protein
MRRSTRLLPTKRRASHQQEHGQVDQDRDLGVDEIHVCRSGIKKACIFTENPLTSAMKRLSK